MAITEKLVRRRVARAPHISVREGDGNTDGDGVANKTASVKPSSPFHRYGE